MKKAHPDILSPIAKGGKEKYFIFKIPATYNTTVVMATVRQVIQTLILSVVIFSCLEPQGDHYEPIKSPEESDITINLSGVNGDDTVYIDGVTNFTYEVNGFPLMLLGAEVKLNDQSVNIGPFAGNSFTIDPRQHPEGFHKMHVKLIARSESGSLASRLSEERIQISVELNAILDSTPAEEAEIIKIDTTGGTLVIHWNKYKKRNFASYTVRKQCAQSYDSYNLYQCEEVVITDPSTTSWTDHGYVGGRVTYTVDITTHLQATFGKLREYWWKPKFTTEVDNKGNATIRWRKPPFYNNIQKCIIEPDGPIKIELPLTDTVYVVPQPLLFAYLHDFKLSLISAHPDRSQTFLHEYYFGTRYFLPAVIPMLYHSQEKLYYGRNSDRIVIMDENLGVMQEIPGYLHYQTSFNSTYFVSMRDNNFYNVDPHTLQETRILESGNTGVTDFVIADNGLIAFSCWEGFRVVDTQNGVEKFAAIPNSPAYYTLSPSGIYLITNNKTIYRYNGTSFISQGVMPAGFEPEQRFTFAANDDIIGTFDPPAGGPTYIMAYDITTRTLKYSVEVAEEGVERLVLDPISKKILVDLWDSNYLFDPETQKLTFLGRNYTTLHNGKLFAQHFRGPDFVYVIDASVFE